MHFTLGVVLSKFKKLKQPLLESKMKIMILTTILSLLSLNTFAQNPTVTCKSYEKVQGWIGTNTHESLNFTAEVESATSLKSAEVSGAYRSDIRDLTSAPKNTKFSSFKYLEDAWCWFAPALPKDIEQIKVGQKFTGYMNILCENDSRPRSYALTCTLK